MQVLIRADSSLAGEQWNIKKVKNPQSEESEVEPAALSKPKADSGGEVVDFPDKKLKRGRGVSASVANEDEAADEKKSATVGSLFGGLWQKIID